MTNLVVLIGILTKDPELRQAGNTSVCTFTLAVDRGKDKDGNDKGADFIKVTVFGRQGENCSKYLTKGSKVCVEGRIQTGSYEKDGKTVYTTDVIGDRTEFLSTKKKEEPKEAPIGFSALDESIPFK